MPPGSGVVGLGVPSGRHRVISEGAPGTRYPLVSRKTSDQSGTRPRRKMTVNETVLSW